ncbi:hypothetical protein CDN99_19290 [Roseateles aquatilis]|uniref:Protein TonB n=1 Tax=Roseateles aquatilis TaxID=431061 RepID=A0A246J2N6_9BURK|nr:hypothetical protein CDN99_19290 [Roseateles aquatilis]
MSVRRRGLALCQALGLALAAMSAQAQTAPAGATPDPKAPLSDVDRAKRDADKVFQWIKFHAEKGEAKKAAEKPHEAAKPDAKAAARTAPAPAAARRQELDPVAERALAARNAAAESAAAPSQAQASTPPPTSQAVAAQATQPETPPPQVVAMAAPSTSAAAGKAPPPAPEPVALPEEDAPLRLVRKVDPEYPRAALAQQRSGSVMVRFMVKPDGSVDAAEAVRTPDRKLGVAAVNAVRQWRFEPIGKPRQVSVEIGFQAE